MGSFLFARRKHKGYNRNHNHNYDIKRRTRL
nr:MAG TPA: hypothetical protein [Caudoviricetes sp.]